MKSMFLFLIVFSVIIFWSCEQNSSGVDQEEAMISEEIRGVIEDSLDLYFEALDDLSEDNFGLSEPNWLGGNSALPKHGASLLRFGRLGRRPVERNIQIINDTDTTATAFIYTKFVGRFVVLKAERNSDSTNIQRYEKPMTHEIERVVHLKKFFNAERSERNWKIIDISFAEGHSPRNLIEIVELTIMAAGIDTVTINNPLAYFMNGTDKFIFPRFTEITLVVKVRNNTTNPVIYPEQTQSTENVRLHYGRNRFGNFARTEFEWLGREGDLNVYEGKWLVREFRGLHHAVIDVIDNGTILVNDPEAYPYESETWAAPYRITLF